MTNKLHYLSLSLGLALPLVACDLPEKAVGETADLADEPAEEVPQLPPQDDEPQDPPQDPPQEDEPQDPPQDLPEVEPPTDEATIIAITGFGNTLAVDATWLYIGGEKVPMRVVKSGGALEPLLADAELDPTLVGSDDTVMLITTDDSHVYWTAGYSSSSYRLLRAGKFGGPVTLLTNVLGPNMSNPSTIVVDDAFVYLSLPDIYNGQQGEGVIRRVPKAGGPSVDLANVLTSVIAVSDSYLYWPLQRQGGGSDLYRADKDGGNVETIVTELGSIYDVRVEGDRLYWSLFDASQYFVRTAIEGEGAATTLLNQSGDEYFFGTPAVTSGGIYWLRPGGADTGGVLSLDLGGNISELVTAPATTPYTPFWGTYGPRIVADESAVYWSYEGSQGGAPRVYRIAR